MTQNRWTSHALPLLLIVAFVAALWVHRIYLDDPPLPSIRGADLVRHAQPTAAFLHNELRAGNLPIWNPYQLAGQPVMAFHVTGMLYPPNLLVMALLPATRAIEVLTVMHLAIAGFFSWLFAARLGLSIAARWVATLAYVCSGALLMGVYLFPCLMVQAWLPAIMWAVHGLASEARLRWGLALTAILCHAFLGGYAQGMVYELMLAVPYGLLLLFTIVKAQARLRVAAIAIGSGVIALGLVAPQLLPTLELTAQSVRSLEGVPYASASFYAATWALLLDGLLGPFADGIGTDSWSPLRWRLALPLLFVPLLAFGQRLPSLRGQWLYFSVALAVAGLFTLGSNSFVFPIFYALPLGDLFRGPIYLAFVYAFLAAILLAIGVDGLAAQLQRWALRRNVVIAAVAGVAALVSADMYSRSSLDVEHLVVSDSVRTPQSLVEFMSERSGRPRVFLQTFGWDPELRFKLGMANGVFALPDYESNSPRAYADYFGVGNPLWHGELSVLGRVRGGGLDATPALLDLMSVRFYAARRSSSHGMPERLLNRTAGIMVLIEDLWLVDRARALPRVYTVDRVLREPDREALMARLLSPSFEPREEVVLLRGEGDTGGLRATAPASSGPRRGGRAAIEVFETERVEVAASCPAECLLVLTDLHYPGWTVRVDGRDAEMLRVNALFRGVMLSPGAHEVVYRFQPVSFRNGVLLAALSFACISICALFVASTGRDHAPIASR